MKLTLSTDGPSICFCFAKDSRQLTAMPVQAQGRVLECCNSFPSVNMCSCHADRMWQSSMHAALVVECS